MSFISKPEVIEKKWGREIILHNSHKYCGKILEFYPHASFSMHFHIEKTETWYVLDGTFILDYINTLDASRKTATFDKGQILTIDPGFPHKLTASTLGGKIIEVSTEHFDHDSYRVGPGDSQSQI